MLQDGTQLKGISFSTAGADSTWAQLTSQMFETLHSLSCWMVTIAPRTREFLRGCSWLWFVHIPPALMAAAVYRLATANLRGAVASDAMLARAVAATTAASGGRIGHIQTTQRFSPASGHA